VVEHEMDVKHIRTSSELVKDVRSF